MIGQWAASEAIYGHIVRSSVGVALLVVLLLALERTLGRFLTPAWRYGLWMLVVLRLVVPVQPAVPFGGVEGVRTLVAGTPSVPKQESVPSPGKRTPAPAPMRPGAGESRPLARTSPRPGSAPSHDPREPIFSQDTLRRVPGATSPSSNSSVPPTAVVLSGASGGPNRSGTDPWKVRLALLFAGAGGLLLGVQALRAIRFELRLRGLPRAREPRVLALLDACAERMELGRNAHLKEHPHLQSPAVTGLLRPTVLLPLGMAERLEEQELRHVFLHELAHWRRRDVPLGFLICALQSLYWFHPLVWVGLGRLRASQEILRDWQALDADRSPAPLSYARTLLKLSESVPAYPAGPLPDFLDGGRELIQRIHMIQAYRPIRRSSLLGITAVASLGWLSFTSAASEDSPGSVTAASALERIPVERVDPAPIWREAMERVLDTPLDLIVEDQTFRDVIAHLRDATGANIVLQESLGWDDADPVTLRLSATPLRDILKALCKAVGMDSRWTLANQAIYMGDDAMERAPQELRFYSVGSLLQEAGDPDELVHELAFLAQVFAHSDDTAWDTQGAYLETWDRLLMVSQSAEVHDGIEVLLNRILNGGAREARPEAQWRVKLKTALEENSELDTQGQTLSEVCAELSQRHGVTILCSESAGVHEPQLSLNKVQLRTVLDWLCAEQGLHVSLENGAIALREHGFGELNLEFYDLSAVAEGFPDLYLEEVHDRVEDIVRSQVDPESWDTNPACTIEHWRHLLLVQNTPEVNAQVGRLIAAMERALSR